ncbi:MAG: sigma-54-dependent Fis family transcriptional regulator, partial [Planctomycetes bacterium]|nr:sigma-54-dependent Fis family transcriptional regulator [Planctomycetota bacterium]
MFDPLILDPAPTDLWLAFQAEPRALTGHGGIVAHWQRSRALGASPDGPRPEDALERGAALRDRTESLDALIARGRGVLERIAAVAHEHDYSLLLADADGVVLKAMGGGGFAAAARQVRLIEGAHWGEQTRGTNAIGTALAEQRPVFVRGSAHYARSYHELVCYAAPVRGPDGSIVGVLDATSVFDRDDRSMGFGVVAAALALEEVLRAHSFGRAGAQVVRALSRTLEHVATPAVLVVPPGRIARCNGAARELLGPHGVRAGLRQVLGLSFAELAAMAGRDGLCCTVGPRRAPMRLHVDPIESEGALIAALVLLEPVQRVSSSPAPPPVRAVAAGGAFDALFAADAATRAALVFARKVAPSELPIMLLAETGSGKELVAQGIHRASGRGDRPFVAVNCGSIQPTLLESELFGYGPGAFTGAERRGHDGYLAAAGAGTLFLDEVAEMPLAMQAALLRVLETRSYRRVGETELRPAHCRIVCATCRDLPALVAAGQFRRDLYFRLRGATVTLPPLRRRSDIAALARHLLERVAETRGIVPTPQLDV